MAKNKRTKEKMVSAAAESAGTAKVKTKMSRKEFERNLFKLQTELSHLHDWVLQEGLRVVVVSEGATQRARAGSSSESPSG